MPGHARIEPLSPDQLDPDSRTLMEGARKLMGFLPNDGLTMARVPGLLKAVSDLVSVIYGPGQLDAQTRRLVAVMSSEAAGCRYCKAHTRHGAEQLGVPLEKLQSIWDFETSDIFTPAERAALKLAWLASLTPNQAGEEEWENARAHFSEDQLLEIIAVVSLFGFLNRWNDSVKTAVEETPASAKANQ